MRTTSSYILIAAVMLGGTARARTQAEIDASCAATYAYPCNNLNFVQASNFRRFWIQFVPERCLQCFGELDELGGQRQIYLERLPDE